MYAPGDDRICTLGIPCGGWKQPTDGLESWENSKVSKIGGYPTWHEKDTAPNLNNLQCLVCKSSDNVVLVAQIYAPIESYERSLYIFCCNTRECSLKAEGWMAFRNQKKIDIAKPEKVETKVDEAPIQNGAVSTIKPSVWDFLADDTFETQIDNAGEDDLLSLLESRDFNLSALKPKVTSQSNKSSKKTTTNKSVAANQNFLQLSTSLPLCKIREQDEDWDYNIDDEEEDVLDKGLDSAHIDSLIATYLKDEDDEENLKTLHALGLGNNDSRPAARDSHLHIRNEDGDDDEDDDVDEGVGRKVTSTDAKFRTEMYFQKRISIDPRQVLRYAYDGLPLWITSPDSSEEQRKNGGLLCPLCGEQRVFECQLMPALLSYISKVAAKKAGTATAANLAATSKALDAELLGTGMDFGVVTVWSCPNSCECESADGLTESIIIQPPPDFA